MSLSVNDRISRQLAPYFRYATDENPSEVVFKWIDPESKELRVHLIYQNCIGCNSHRFERDVRTFARTYSVQQLHFMNTYFCSSCLKKVSEILKSYNSGYPTEESKVASNAYNRLLYGRCKLVRASRL